MAGSHSWQILYLSEKLNDWRSHLYLSLQCLFMLLSGFICENRSIMCRSLFLTTVIRQYWLLCRRLKCVGKCSLAFFPGWQWCLYACIHVCVAAISWPRDMSEVGEVARQAVNALLTMDPRKRPGATRESLHAYLLSVWSTCSCGKRWTSQQSSVSLCISKDSQGFLSICTSCICIHTHTRTHTHRAHTHTCMYILAHTNVHIHTQWTCSMHLGTCMHTSYTDVVIHVGCWNRWKSLQTELFLVSKCQTVSKAYKFQKVGMSVGQQ